MGICYTAWIHDDYSWEGIGKNKIDEQVRLIIPCAKRIASFDKWLIYDTDKIHPEKLVGKVIADTIMFTADCGGQDLPKVIDCST